MYAIRSYYGHGQYVAALIKDDLLAVAVVVVHIQHRHTPVGAQVMGRHGGGVEVAEAAEGAPLGMVPGRAHQGVGQMAAAQNLLGSGQPAVLV